MTTSEPRRRLVSEETAREVLEAAVAEFVERGYDGLDISDIARCVGVTPDAIYSHWPQKDDLVASAVDTLLERLLPVRRLQDIAVLDWSVSDIVAGWGAHLLESDSVRNSLAQVFGSARSNAMVNERLKRFLDAQADQLSRLIERGKDEGYFDPEFDTVALTLFVQAVGIGTHLVLSAGRADRHVPSAWIWSALLVEILGTVPSRPQHGQRPSP